MACGTAYTFDEPLREGTILARPNRFIMDVDFDGEVVRCHCPVVSRIGDIDTAGLSCLVSDSHNPRRKLPLTVEALLLTAPGDPQRRWVGLNQNASNRYVEHFLRQGAVPGIVDVPVPVRREVPLGSSRLDFLVDESIYLEVKTPLRQLECEVPAGVGRLDQPPFSSTDRAVRHLHELADSLADHDRAVILYCLYYQNDGFHFYHGTTYDEVMACVDEVRERGVELWQADFSIDAAGVELQGCHPLETW